MTSVLTASAVAVPTPNRWSNSCPLSRRTRRDLSASPLVWNRCSVPLQNGTIKWDATKKKEFNSVAYIFAFSILFPCKNHVRDLAKAEVVVHDYGVKQTLSINVALVHHGAVCYQVSTPTERRFNNSQLVWSSRTCVCEAQHSVWMWFKYLDSIGCTRKYGEIPGRGDWL